MVSTDLLYLVRSPYGPTDDFAITFANFVASIGTATPTASTIPRWDAHVNMSANNFLAGFASTATAAATTTLTVSSAYNQYFTGSTTQTVVLPVTSTLALGFPFRIINNSTGVVTVQSSGANTIQAMAPGSTLLLTCILISGTTAASWDAQYIIAADVSGAVLLNPGADQSIIAHNLFLTNGGFISGAILTPQGATREGQITSVGLAGATGDFIASSYYSGGAGSAPTYWMYKSRSATVGSFATVQTGDTLGRIEIFADDGTQFKQSATMVWQAVGTISTGVVPSYCTFSTTSSAGTLLQAWTVDQNQVFSLANPLAATSGGTGLATLGTGVAAALGDNVIGPASAAMAVSNAPTGWTPVPTFSTVGDLSVSYAVQSGNYVQVGNIVIATFQITFTPTYTTASGNLLITGLPVTPANNAFCAVNYSGITLTTLYTNIFANAQSDGNIYTYQNGSTQTRITLSTTQLTSGNAYSLYATITYMA